MSFVSQQQLLRTETRDLGRGKLCSIIRIGDWRNNDGGYHAQCLFCERVSLGGRDSDRGAALVSFLDRFWQVWEGEAPAELCGRARIRLGGSLALP